MEETDNAIGSLTITTANMRDMEIDRAINDAKQASEELLIRDENGRVINNQTSLLNTG